MKGIVVVETQAEFDAWKAKQPSFYESSVKGTDEEKHFAELTEQLKAEKEKEASKGHHD